MKIEYIELCSENKFDMHSSFIYILIFNSARNVSGQNHREQQCLLPILKLINILIKKSLVRQKYKLL